MFIGKAKPRRIVTRATLARAPASSYLRDVPRKCPTCGRPVSAPQPVDAAARARGERSPSPFCSDRCRLADLGKWLDGGYRIGAPVTEEDLDQGLPTEGGAGDLDDGKDHKKVPQ
jgi:hypothetical protein